MGSVERTQFRTTLDFMFTKTLQRTEDLYIQFTNEELEQLDVKPGDKFSCHVENGELLLKKYATIDIDISEWSREVLEFVITQSVERDISVNQVIEESLTSYLSKYGTE